MIVLPFLSSIISPAISSSNMLLHLLLSNTLTAITFLLLGVSLDPEFRALAVDWRYRQIDTNIYATGRLIASISDEAVSAIRCLASRPSYESKGLVPTLPSPPPTHPFTPLNTRILPLVCPAWLGPNVTSGLEPLEPYPSPETEYYPPLAPQPISYPPVESRSTIDAAWSHGCDMLMGVLPWSLSSSYTDATSRPAAADAPQDTDSTKLSASPHEGGTVVPPANGSASSSSSAGSLSTAAPLADRSNAGPSTSRHESHDVAPSSPATTLTVATSYMSLAELQPAEEQLRAKVAEEVRVHGKPLPLLAERRLRSRESGRRWKDEAEDAHDAGFLQPQEGRVRVGQGGREDTGAVRTKRAARSPLGQITLNVAGPSGSGGVGRMASGPKKAVVDVKGKGEKLYFKLYT
ncbi:hypothetical protein B0H13DRAFT_1860881 [Mycena leptocephala]|nr:hypothetical protein B0H13DRAFT_1860881 [Mycena leptocephala]